VRTDLGSMQTDTKAFPSSLQAVLKKIGQLEQIIAGLIKRVDEAETELQAFVQALGKLRTVTEEVRQTRPLHNPTDIEARLQKIEKLLEELQKSIAALHAAQVRIAVVDAEGLFCARVFAAGGGGALGSSGQSPGHSGTSGQICSRPNPS